MVEEEAEEVASTEAAFVSCLLETVVTEVTLAAETEMIAVTLRVETEVMTATLGAGGQPEEEGVTEELSTLAGAG